MAGDNWLDGSNTSIALSRCKDGTACYIWRVNAVNPNANGTTGDDGCGPLLCDKFVDKRDQLNLFIHGYYGNVNGANTTVTPYKRSVLVNEIIDEQEAEVTVTVTWELRGKTRTIVIKDHLFNWSGI